MKNEIKEVEKTFQLFKEEAQYYTTKAKEYIAKIQAKTAMTQEETVEAQYFTAKALIYFNQLKKLGDELEQLKAESKNK
ncbi:hypothetical protein [Candidatus Phytoplasma solani]|uniref:Uncharacterized protein n=1 Tax=Candidatus Phytoplasma solani TaxID=69896 RepID=A0A421NXE9_9MOLU|nr:hypothetical protein [Candidatus Phytoplasma solani]RMI88711.1 hypothetical protein PSSA1_v1c3070 [Candidatus Phytoplasma solani]